MIVSDEQREENFQEYLRLLRDPDYVDVCFDQESGGVSAVHLKHKLDAAIGSFGIKKGDYEIIALRVLRKRGHVVVLESELAPNGIKTPDGQIDGMIMDIKATEKDGKWSIKKKFHRAAKQGAECVVLYFHKMSLFSQERIYEGWQRFLIDKDSQPYVDIIKRVICVVEDNAFDWHPPR